MAETRPIWLCLLWWLVVVWFWIQTAYCRVISCLCVRRTQIGIAGAPCLTRWVAHPKAIFISVRNKHEHRLTSSPSPTVTKVIVGLLSAVILFYYSVVHVQKNGSDQWLGVVLFHKAWCATSDELIGSCLLIEDAYRSAMQPVGACFTVRLWRRCNAVIRHLY